jgi:type II secretory pathway pseudopilin PulG
MSAEVTTLVVAVIGVAGTLLAPIFTHRMATRAKQLELGAAHQQRREERDEARHQQALADRQSMYASLNTAAQQYDQQLRACVRELADGGLGKEARAALEEERQAYRILYSRAQMVLSDKVMMEAEKVTQALGDAYGVVKRLDGRVTKAARLTAADGKAETIESARELSRAVCPLIDDMRQLMREDLGVAGIA